MITTKDLHDLSVKESSRIEAQAQALIELAAYFAMPATKLVLVEAALGLYRHLYLAEREGAAALLGGDAT